MRYMGGKYKLKSQIGELINSVRADGQTYWEPFVGSAWVTTQLESDDKVICSDLNPYLISLWKELLNGWIPPDYITEKDYEWIKQNKDIYPHLTAFVGFGCSWGGKWFGGYARDKKRNYAKESKNSLLNNVLLLRDLDIAFHVWNFIKQKAPDDSCFIYCDPPYKSTTGYGAVKKWNADKFWNKVRQLDKEGHTILISEYSAPEDFKCVESFRSNKTLNTENQKSTVEKLFMRRKNEKS